MAIYDRSYMINEGFIDRFQKEKVNNNKKHGIITKKEANKCIKIMRKFIDSDDTPAYIKQISVATISKSYDMYLKNDKDDLIAGDVERVFSPLYKNDTSGKNARYSEGLPEDYNKFMSEHYRILNLMVKKVNADIRNTLGDGIVFSIDKNIDPRYDAYILTSKKPKES